MSFVFRRCWLRKGINVNGSDVQGSVCFGIRRGARPAGWFKGVTWASGMALCAGRRTYKPPLQEGEGDTLPLGPQQARKTEKRESRNHKP